VVNVFKSAMAGGSASQASPASKRCVVERTKEPRGLIGIWSISMILLAKVLAGYQTPVARSRV
jgi:hypothetical protein